ncbi:hypothetical protein HDU76_005848, partial [Blyttiomyces sp. JEL0837]
MASSRSLPPTPPARFDSDQTINSSSTMMDIDIVSEGVSTMALTASALATSGSDLSTTAMAATAAGPGVPPDVLIRKPPPHLGHQPHNHTHSSPQTNPSFIPRATGSPKSGSLDLSNNSFAPGTPRSSSRSANAGNSALTSPMGGKVVKNMMNKIIETCKNAGDFVNRKERSADRSGGLLARPEDLTTSKRRNPVVNRPSSVNRPGGQGRSGAQGSIGIIPNAQTRHNISSSANTTTKPTKPTNHMNPFLTSTIDQPGPVPSPVKSQSTRMHELFFRLMPNSSANANNSQQNTSSGVGLKGPSAGGRYQSQIEFSTSNSIGKNTGQNQRQGSGRQDKHGHPETGESVSALRHGKKKARSLMNLMAKPHPWGMKDDEDDVQQVPGSVEMGGNSSSSGSGSGSCSNMGGISMSSGSSSTLVNSNPHGQDISQMGLNIDHNAPYEIGSKLEGISFIPVPVQNRQNHLHAQPRSAEAAERGLGTVPMSTTSTASPSTLIGQSVSHHMSLPPTPAKGFKVQEGMGNIVAPEDESKSRHSEVVALTQGRRRLSARFTENYELGELLGDGAFGFVMTARRRKDAREVAVKFIVREKITPEVWVNDITHPNRKIPNEIHILRQLDHPGIIKYIDHLFEGDKYILLITELHGTEWDSNNPKLSASKNPGLKLGEKKKVPDVKELSPEAAAILEQQKKECSPLCRLTPEQERMIRRRTSCDLFECIDAHKKIPEPIAKKIFAQIALAVEYLHGKQIVHRDLKDENIVIDSDYRAKIIDFGSASKIAQTPSEYFTKFNGTTNFASPEVTLGHPYRGPEAEMWSLGVLLFTIIFGENPFQNKSDIVAINLRFPGRLESDLDPR